MTRPAWPRLLPLLCVLIPALAEATVPLGYHRRVVDGWVLLAISTPITDYTVCVLDPPAGGSRKPSPDLYIRQRTFAGHRLVRADGPDPSVLVRDAMAADPARTEWDQPLERVSEAGRHLLALAGMRWPEVTGVSPDSILARPMVLLAGAADPSELMAVLTTAAALPATDPHPTDVPAPGADPLPGWWRHVPGSTDEIAIGVLVPRPAPEKSFAVRVATRALQHRFERLADSATTRAVDTRQGQVLWTTWPASPDSVEVIRGSALDILQSLRETAIPDPEFMAHREFIRSQDAQRFRGNDRWFEIIILRELEGRLPGSAYQSRGDGEDLDRESMRETFRTFMPRDLFTVTRGVWTPPTDSLTATPTEIWTAAPRIVEALEPRERVALATAAIARARNLLWGDGDPEGVTVEGDWVSVRKGAPLTGRVVETLRFDDGIRRDFYPEGAAIEFATWWADGTFRRTVLGAPREVDARDGDRLLARLHGDPLNAVWVATRQQPYLLRYLGGIKIGTEVFQGVEINAPTGRVVLYLDVVAGAPRRVQLRPEVVGGAPVEFRCVDYARQGELSYPRRLERYRGVNRESVLRVRSAAVCSRLAALERLQ